ncbi:DUF2383 domain-containing protein [Rhodanobacter denitrificans]|uniref:DUF2383 domain-containing protein n=1 Tax=Rhodanobacter denitrificans TaxID=666685 RepID=M4NHX1_9GAMM|nr:DUF2383 domain-containing protein [Rhodanobacter denitrificans]AGG90530.1 protein of unknown function (DUF2383) [Rhodanobacter denitrificans]UJM85913.1 PA2169 family four-helix-bundle protein [Rhodanobacter denitrificans]
MPQYLPVSACNALIRRSIDLRQLYRHAATACEPGLRMVLNDNVHTLDLLIADLQAQLRDRGGRPCRHGSWRGTVRRHLAGWLVRTAARRDSAWIHVLAHDESGLLNRFEQAIAAAPAEAVLVLRRQLPRLRGIHLDMHSLGGTARY